MTSISFQQKRLIEAKRRPSFFVKANTWLQYIMLSSFLWKLLFWLFSSPWKVMLDQSMTFQKEIPEQWQTLRLSTLLGVGNPNKCIIVVIIVHTPGLIRRYVFWLTGEYDTTDKSKQMFGLFSMIVRMLCDTHEIKGLVHVQSKPHFSARHWSPCFVSSQCCRLCVY